MKQENGNNCYVARNPKFNRYRLPLNAQLRLLHREFFVIEESTVNASQYNFTTSRGRGLALNRYINIMAIEETLFPPIPGTKMEESFYQKLETRRSKSQEKGVESESKTLGSLLDGNGCNKNSSTLAIFKHTANILASMIPAGGIPAGSTVDPRGAGTRSESHPFLYINGNLIDLENAPLFVASQAPTAAGISDFFATLYKYKIQLVIMLTKTVEDEVEKACQYWPTGNEATLIGNSDVDNIGRSSETCNSLSWGNMTVSMNPEEPYYVDKELKLVYRPLQIQPRCGGDVMPLLHVQYTGWPDLGVPSSEVAFCELLKIVDAYQGAAPVLVHCSAGVGRTGTFIGTYAILQAIRSGCFENKTLRQTVMSMRRARYWMVQRIEQYLFMYWIILTKLNLDASEFAANLQQSALEYQQEVARIAILRERQRLARPQASIEKTCLTTNVKRGRTK
ncbi:unnamed protein product [Phytomonas sp. EM1]|nr:unnamed protein product [Phytomonas sp. EM1]|eukprot:CCW60081.1 unnamed protein product [Phytomonas sp. isolate EM1]